MNDKYPTTWEFVTPETAKDYLRHNIDNRPVRLLVVGRYAHDLRCDQFPTTHHAIAFNSDGILEDGQHRLNAIIKADKGMWLLVVRNLPPGTQEFMDRGIKRSASDFVDGPHKAVRVGAMRVLLALRYLNYEFTPASLSTALNTVTDADVNSAFKVDSGLNEDLLDLAPGAALASRKCVLSPSGLLVAGIAFPDIAENAYECLSSGAGMDEGNPLLTVRNYKIRDNYKKTGERGVMTHAAVRIFETVSKGQTLRKFTLHGVTRPLTVRAFF